MATTRTVGSGTPLALALSVSWCSLLCCTTGLVSETVGSPSTLVQGTNGARLLKHKYRSVTQTPESTAIPPLSDARPSSSRRQTPPQQCGRRRGVPSVQCPQRAGRHVVPPGLGGQVRVAPRRRWEGREVGAPCSLPPCSVRSGQALGFHVRAAGRGGGGGTPCCFLHFGKRGWRCQRWPREVQPSRAERPGSASLGL